MGLPYAQRPARLETFASAMCAPAAAAPFTSAVATMKADGHAVR
ncbi:MAG: hypothetical protein ACREKA_08775 [Candidatus Methylomirabilales bacterium]